MFATAAIGKGRITRLETAAALAVPGVHLVLSHLDALDLTSADYYLVGGWGSQSFQPLLDDRIAYHGQPIAMVVATTLEAAIEAAHLIEAEYEPEPLSATIDGADGEPILLSDVVEETPDRVLGDADQALADAEVRVEATYDSPAQHQNPMELISTVAEWRGETLVIYEGTQTSGGIQHGLARQLGVDAADIEVISPYLGGGFGQKNSLQPQTALVALAARWLDRPVKFVVPRTQLFHDASFRPASRHRVRLGGDRSGRMTAAIHETVHQTSRHDVLPSEYTATTSALYGWEHFRGREHVVQLDTQTPGYMRTPFEHQSAFALESAIDEFAYEIAIDPVALRLANDTMTEPISELPFSSRHVAACLDRGAELFGWSSRTPEPGSMVGDDGAMIGWGVAIGSYPTSTSPAIARLTLGADGRATIMVVGHEMGQGIRSAIAPIVSDALSIPVDQVEVLVGDTRDVPQALTAGAWGTATAIPAVRQATVDLLTRIRGLDPEPGSARPPHEVLVTAGRDLVEVEARHRAPGQPESIFEESLGTGHPAPAGPLYTEFATFSYIAHFVEVRVEPTTRRARVPRVVSVVDCGRVMSPVTAASQVRGGVVWGIGAALRERSEVDPRYGGFLNCDLAEYVIPVNADIGEIEVDFINEPDPLLNRDGLKTLGEVVMAGVAPAIANAIFHATGQRHRSLPIRLEDLL
jgi:xanthine dehydrogenase YagR molybdenum-binding subunit